MKTVKNVIASIMLLTTAGIVVTLTTKSILQTKREVLYAYQQEETESSTPTETTKELTGPMASPMTKEKYMGEILLLEQQIAEIWSNITDMSSNSAFDAVKYEKGKWEQEYKEILDLYYSIQSGENAELLKQEETAFIADRDKRAQDAAKKAGETYDGLTYNKEYIRLTKEKTYEYIERYFAEE